MAVIKRIGSWSLAKIYVLIMGIIGLVGALVNALFYFGLQALNDPSVQGVDVSTVYWGFVTIPLQLMVLGLISAFLFTWAYNWLVPLVGGIKIDLKLEKKHK